MPVFRQVGKKETFLSYCPLQEQNMYIYKDTKYIYIYTVQIHAFFTYNLLKKFYICVKKVLARFNDISD